MMKIIIWWLGKRSEAVRLWWYKYSGGNAMWGIITFIRDTPAPTESTHRNSTTSQDLQNIMKNLKKLK